MAGARSSHGGPRSGRLLGFVLQGGAARSWPLGHSSQAGTRDGRPRPEPRDRLLVSAWACSPLPRKPGACSSARVPSRPCEPGAAHLLTFIDAQSRLPLLCFLVVSPPLCYRFHVIYPPLSSSPVFLLCSGGFSAPLVRTVHDWDLWSLLGQRIADLFPLFPCLICRPVGFICAAVVKK
ncbi:uncharacterized protein LOC120674181 isoform X2 [Panicum virgatum]|uniref:uncharacterized protein LOC120674181 isoform X2 n=1 Tax=Panicum virgatum TaxID=38727 RepID=UPI0019D620AD|nr:uncharacterized protein LOC120674181 isoform X2 [Panicum virgatum]